ncbi:MAG: carboxypeptidase regulatory-like domain-containing protein [Acidobacteriota bacterium]
MTPHTSRRLVAAVLLTIGVGVVQDARAQARSTVIGTIRGDAGAVLSGVTVTLVSTRVPGGPLTTVTNSLGEYRLSGLRPGIYELTAVLQGLAPVKRTELHVPIGTTLTLDVTLSGTVTDVRGSAASVVDVMATAATIKFSREDLESLPVSGLGFLQLGPGITPAAAFGSGADTNQLLIDGSPLILAGVGAPEVHAYWMEEAQIVGVGAHADTGEFSGAVARIALRSGTNQLSGLLEYGTRRPQWVGDNTDTLPEALRGDFRPQRILSQWTGEAQAGGPIARDRLFFFTGVRSFRNEVFQAGRIGDVPFDARRRGFLIKLDWVPSNSVTVGGHIETDRNRNKGNLAINALPETAGDFTGRFHSWNSRVTWTVSPKTVVELRSAGLDSQSLNLPSERRAGPPPRTDRVTGISSGNAAGFGDAFATRSVTSASLTRFADGFAGKSHELQIGFEFERTTSRGVSGIPGGRSFRDAAGVPEFMTVWEGNTVQATGKRTTLYAQDTWRLINRVSIHPGVRLAFNRGAVPDRGSVFATSPVSPRLAVAWDVLGDHRTVARAAYDRLHEGLSTAIFSFMNISGQTPQITYRFLGPDTLQETNRVTPSNAAVDDGLAHADLDQYMVGIERELFRDGSVMVQYVRRNFDKIWVRINTAAQYAPVQRRDPGQDGQLGTADDGELITVFNLLNPGQTSMFLTNPDDAFRQYDAFQVIAQKRYARNWQFQAAYTWSRTRGTIANTGGANRASSADTGPGGLFSNPNSRINAGGPTPADYTHQVNLQGTWLVPAWGGVGLSASYRYLSGAPWGRVAQITGLQQGTALVRIEPRGTRRVDAGNVLDVRVEKTLPLGVAGRTLGIYADVFNLTNRGVPPALVVVEGSGATFGRPTGWASPRTAQLAVRVKF